MEKEIVFEQKTTVKKNKFIAAILNLFFFRIRIPLYRKYKKSYINSIITTNFIIWMFLYCFIYYKCIYCCFTLFIYRDILYIHYYLCYKTNFNWKYSYNKILKMVFYFVVFHISWYIYINYKIYFTNKFTFYAKCFYVKYYNSWR